MRACRLACDVTGQLKLGIQWRGRLWCWRLPRLSREDRNNLAASAPRVPFLCCLYQLQVVMVASYRGMYPAAAACFLLAFKLAKHLLTGHDGCVMRTSANIALRCHKTTKKYNHIWQKIKLNLLCELFWCFFLEWYVFDFIKVVLDVSIFVFSWVIVHICHWFEPLLRAKRNLGRASTANLFVFF